MYWFGSASKRKMAFHSMCCMWAEIGPDSRSSVPGWKLFIKSTHALPKGGEGLSAGTSKSWHQTAAPHLLDKGTMDFHITQNVTGRDSPVQKQKCPSSFSNSARYEPDFQGQQGDHRSAVCLVCHQLLMARTNLDPTLRSQLPGQ